MTGAGTEAGDGGNDEVDANEEAGEDEGEMG